MGFKVFCKGGEVVDVFEADSDRYHFTDKGMLVALRGDGSTKRTYSPNGWDYIEEPQREGSGRVAFV